MKTPNRSNALAWWSAATILVSAFLLFQVQPVISKKILPWFGGSPAVWSTCVLFFQLVLLGGYAYSHWLIRHVPSSRQGLIHVSLLAIALATLLIGPRDFWKPADGNYPALRILVLLGAVVGTAYFSLSTTGPLVQAWFSQLYPGRSPYRLYALSNVGSLAALLSYPFLIERALYVNTQWWAWALGFVVFALLIGAMAWTMWQVSKAAHEPDAQETLAAAKRPDITAAEGLVTKDAMQTDSVITAEVVPDGPPNPLLRIGWLALAALGSMALLAVTNHLCQDIAVVPFMWVIPLSLYLLSFIICFDSERWYMRKLFGTLAVLSIVWITAVQNYGKVDDALQWVQKPLDKQKIGFTTKGGTDYKIEFPITFSGVNDKCFDGISWVVKQLDGALQSIRGKRWPTDDPDADVLFARQDENKDGKLVNEELPEILQSDLPEFDANTDGGLSAEEFGALALQRKPTFRLKFRADTYDFNDNMFAAATAYMLILFFICMVCHGELVKSKPLPQHLTSFYLSISAGGAAGGLFVALICPQMFKTHFELALSIIAGYVAGCVALANDGRETWLKGREILQWAAAFLLVGGVLIIARGNISGLEKNTIAMERNFYGTAYVSRLGDEDDPSESGLALYNGRIWHGFQYADPSRWLEPTTYYVEGTGAALAVTENPRRNQGKGLRVAVIGLGTGSMAAHGRKGDTFRFYDIDPKIVHIARTYFHYLDEKNPATTEVILGDARISMERELKEGSQNYDAIILDAFSGDAIPAHLLTDESFGLYEKHLRKDDAGHPVGVVAVHISNRYLDLKPVVAAIARKYGYETWNVDRDDGGGAFDTGSEWVLVSKNKSFMNNPTIRTAGAPLGVEVKNEILWTDQYTALIPILK